MRRTAIALVGLAAALTLAPSAGAAGYATNGPLSPTAKTAVDPQVVLTPGGGRVVAWVQNGGDGQTAENISVRSASPGGDFGATQTFANTTGFARLQMAAGTDGTVALAWIDHTTNAIRVARRAPGEATFTEAAPLKPSSEIPSELRLAVAGGNAYVAFDSTTSGPSVLSSVWAGRLAAGDNTVRLEIGTGAGGSLDHAQFNAGQPTVLVETPDLAIDGGQPVVTWQRETFAAAGQTGRTQLELSHGVPAGTFPAPGIVVTIGSATSSAPSVRPTIAAGGGRTYVLWATATDQLVFKDLAAPATTVAIPSDTKFAGPLFAGADDSGALIAAWGGIANGLRSPQIEAAVVDPGVAPPTATALTPPGPGRRLDDLAVAADGSALVVFDREPEDFRTTEHVEASLRVGTGAFGPVEDISGVQDVPSSVRHDASAAVAPGGRALALWSASDHTGVIDQLLHLSERDTAAPSFDAIDAPATATVGTPARFTASASDALSGASVSWDFGDGSVSDGPAVAHTFSSPGPATVTVTATDGAGNTTQQTRVVAVAAPPGPAADRTPPSIGKVSLTHKRFRAGRGATALRLTLSERATLVVTVKRGRVVRGTVVRASARAGAVKQAIGARFAGQKLRPGLYTATVAAIDGAGNRSKTHSVKFRVVK
jgi:hypothetical protein